MKVFNVDNITMTSQIMPSYKKINIASEKILNYRVTSPNNHCCLLSNSILAGISVIICCFLFLRKERVHVNIFSDKNNAYGDLKLGFLDYLKRYIITRVCWYHCVITVKTTGCNKDRLKTLFSSSLPFLHCGNDFKSSYITYDIFNNTAFVEL